MNRSNKKYSYSEVRKLLDLIGKGATRKEASEALRRPVRGVERQIYVIKKALELDLEERKDFLERNHANVSLVNKAISDYLALKTTIVKTPTSEAKSESKADPDDLLELEEKLNQARQVFEEAIVDYALVASKEIYKEKIERIKDCYKSKLEKVKGKVEKMEKKIKDLEIVVDQARRSNISYNIRRRLLSRKS